VNPVTLLAAIESHLRSLGWFDRVNMHEVASPPGRGLSADVWETSLTTVPEMSGMASVSIRLEFAIRILCHADREPRDTIDVEMLGAVSDLFLAFCGDFELGGQVLQIDLMGRYGPGLNSASGYVVIDGQRYRMRLIELPLIIDDVWTEAP
jgi:hypothetical protein